MSQIDGFRPSKLYHLEPIGIGTANVESLTSYIKRLAQSHNVSPGMLLEKIILPELNKPYINMYYLNSGSLKLCGYSDVIKGLVDILENSTLNRDLKYLTLLPLEGFVNSLRLNKSRHSWCPLCYNEMRQSGQAIFDKLIWNIEGIEICKKHKVKLEQICPYCGKDTQLISRRSRVGYCDRCNAWLGMSSASAPIDDDMFNQIYDNIGTFLVERSKNTDIRSQFNDNIKEVLSLFNSQRGFYSAFNISAVACDSWLRGNKPSLYHALTLSLQLGISLNEMLTTEIDLAKVIIKNQLNNADLKHIHHIKGQYNSHNINYEKIKHSLNFRIHSYDGTSLSKFCKDNNTTPTTLKNRFPIESEKLSKLYQVHKESISHQGNSSSDC